MSGRPRQLDGASWAGQRAEAGCRSTVDAPARVGSKGRRDLPRAAARQQIRHHVATSPESGPDGTPARPTTGAARARGTPPFLTLLIPDGRPRPSARMVEKRGDGADTLRRHPCAREAAWSTASRGGVPGPGWHQRRGFGEARFSAGQGRGRRAGAGGTPPFLTFPSMMGGAARWDEWLKREASPFVPKGPRCLPCAAARRRISQRLATSPESGPGGTPPFSTLPPMSGGPARPHAWSKTEVFLFVPGPMEPRKDHPRLLARAKDAHASRPGRSSVPESHEAAPFFDHSRCLACVRARGGSGKQGRWQDQHRSTAFLCRRQGASPCCTEFLRSQWPVPEPVPGSIAGEPGGAGSGPATGPGHRRRAHDRQRLQPSAPPRPRIPRHAASRRRSPPFRRKAMRFLTPSWQAMPP